ncbi:PREDICTED: uncharacterized protein LOC109243157 [Nicotiana attenuata]|uniref:uncharacterized protein LOC109243157 n=1 Tax=Nicotiana attenuata TaxID=49451 RepID=UPI0009055C48|nr:PREDICTED: uncharacterized protein LOC109243157 [Nicotiana attenuata]
MHGVAFALTDPKPIEANSIQMDQWVHANKVCRHTIISTISNELFDVYVSYKEEKEIWESMIRKYTAEDATKQKFVIGNYYKWEMTEDKDIIAQINEYHKLIEDLKSEDISLPEQFVAGMLIEKLPKSWSDYKQQLKHKHKQLSMKDLVKHIIIENTNRKQVVADKGKEIATRANLVEDNKRQNKSNNRQPGHHAAQCRKRVGNDNPAKAKVNLTEAIADDIIAAVVSQVNFVANVKDRVLDSSATRHICADKKDFVSYTQVEEGEEVVYLGDPRTTPILD